MHDLRITGLLPFLFALLLGACDQAPKHTVLDPALVAENNRGVGLMGQFRYAEAHQVFTDLVQVQPDLATLQVNLAIATLNRQQPGDEQAALARMLALLERQPEQLDAHYVAGLMRLYVGEPDKATRHFQQVVDADPTDAYARYYLGQCLAQQGDHAAALSLYQQAMKQDPYLRSAYYGAFQALQRLGRRDEARALVADYQRLANNPRSRLAEFKYSRMGRRAEARTLGHQAEPMTAPPSGPLFVAAPTLDLPTVPATKPSRPLGITPVELNGQALFVHGGDLSTGLLLGRQADGGYRPVASPAFADSDKVNAALWGDYDNDGLTDLYLCRQGANQLWRQTAQGEWQDVTEQTQTAAGALDTVDGGFFDADHDGDLDLFLVNADGNNELLNNNLDGSFRLLAAQQGLTGEGVHGRQVIPVDLDADRDLDIVVLNADAPHEVYLNDRLWQYRPAEGMDDFRNTPALAGLAVDLDNDGRVELVTLDPKGQLRNWSADDKGSYVSQVLWQLGEVPGWAQLAASDLDGDGVQDLLVANHQAWHALGMRADGSLRQLYSQAAATPLQGMALVWDKADTGMGLVAIEGGKLHQWRPGPGRHGFMALSLSGREAQAESMRSNSSGIGARLSVRRGEHWTLLNTLRIHSGPGQGLQPLAVGLGSAGQADFVAIDWSDGVFQSELALATGQHHRITETQRQLSSCPVLFVWDGEQYRFVSDVLGVGGIGYAVGPGEYAQPRPRESFLLPEGLLKPRAGRYVLKIGEPMEESAYLDSLALAVYDLPPGWQMVLDERMGIAGPEPSSEPRFYRRELLPVAASNETGDMLARISQVDGKAAEVGQLDMRFIGRLAHEHSLTLEFDRPLGEGEGSPLLMIDGWVEYPYSQTSFAAWQADAAFEAPSLEAQDSDGNWHRLLDQFGYPAGMPRRMSVPLSDLPHGTRALRLRTNMEIYWDRISVVYAESLPEVKLTRLQPVAAEALRSGFALRTTHAQRLPHYDYQNRSPYWDTRYQAGHYTRFGPVRELVSAHDEAVAIIGPGEEVQAEFAVPPAALEGWSRQLVLEARGWAKDMDLFTRDGETVGPLPTAGKPGEQRTELHARFNTRYQAGY